MFELGESVDHISDTEKGKVNLYESCYVIYKLPTVVQDPRPLYVFADKKVPKTKNDNMEPGPELSSRSWKRRSKSWS